MAAVEEPIKSDPEEGSHSPIAIGEDEDVFEDTGELEIPKELPAAWMVKVPKALYESWADITDDEPIQVGVIRRFASKKTKVILNPQGQAAKYNAQVPNEYEMRDTGRHGNTFIFSEKDLPDFKRKRNFARQQGDIGVNKKYKKGQPWRSKSVPKQTILAASAVHEAQWFPVENQQYRAVMDKRMVSEQKSKSNIRMLSGDAATFGNMILGGSKQGDGYFGNFLGAAPVPKTQKPKDKAYRMPPDQLTQLLTEAFQDYEYYHLSTLRARTKQPEAYIREMLKEIAIYVPAGDHAGTFKLNDDMRTMKGVGASSLGAAPKLEDNQSEFDTATEDDSNLEMEDVKP